MGKPGASPAPDTTTTTHRTVTCTLCATPLRLSRRGRLSHCKTPAHAAAATAAGLVCDAARPMRYFFSARGHGHHLTRKHAPPHACAECTLDFASQCALDAHRAASFHPSRWPFPCAECRLGFRTLSAFTQHTDLHARRPVACAAEACRRRFKSAAGMVSHIEGGHCAAGPGGCGALYKLLAEHEPAEDEEDHAYRKVLQSMGLLRVGDTEEGEVEEENWDSDSDAGVLLLTPTSSVCSGIDGGGMLEPEPSITTLPAAAPAPETHAEPSAQPKLYRCSETVDGKSKKFMLLASLVAHLESGACEGGSSVLADVLRELRERLQGTGTGAFQWLG